MKIKKIIVLLLCSFITYTISVAQTDTVKAKILDDGSQDAEKFYNSGITNFASKNYSGAINDFS
jgi:outer membrane protein assembly factor BamD (BamD/ComL family)